MSNPVTPGRVRHSLPGSTTEPVATTTWRIAVLPGDGIGSEVMAEGLQVLTAVASRCGAWPSRFLRTSRRATEYLRHGNPLPESSFAACEQADAILLGAMGLPSVRWPDGKEMTPQLDLRERLDLYNGVRPIRLFHELHSPLKNCRAGDIDLVIVAAKAPRGCSRRVCPGGRATRKSPTCCASCAQCGASAAALRLVQERRKHCTLVDKANVLPSMAFFRAIFDEVAQEFPNVQTEHIYVDAAALFLVQKPHRFDVLVTENMFGDILSDLAADLSAAWAWLHRRTSAINTPSSNRRTARRPDIAGKDIANPIATILSVALMLDWLGTEETKRGAAMIRSAVETVLSHPDHRTVDLGGRLSTRAMGDLILEQQSMPMTGTAPAKRRRSQRSGGVAERSHLRADC